MGEVLGARNPTTIREHLEAIRNDHEQEYHGLCCAGCVGSWPCDAHAHAVVALAQLDNASVEVVQFADRFTAFRLVADPDPGVGAEHAPKEHP